MSSQHPPPPPPLTSRDEDLRYARPPYMDQAHLGLSGHNQFKAAGLRTPMPSYEVAPTPFDDDVSSEDPVHPEALYNYSRYDPSTTNNLVSGLGRSAPLRSGAHPASRSRTGPPHRQDDWDAYRGAHVIRNNDLQYHYAEPFGFRQVILNSLNHTSTEHPDNPGADFTVQVGTQQGQSLQTVAQDLRSNAVILNDITLPDGQYIVEDNWSRIDFSEGIAIYDDFREVHLDFPNRFPNGDSVRMSCILPLTDNDIKSISFESDTVFVLETEKDHSSNIRKVQEIWESELALQSFSPATQGQINLSTRNAILEPVHNDNKKFRVQLLNSTIDTTVTEICGSLMTGKIPTPFHLASTINSLFEETLVVRHDGFRNVDHTLFPDDPHVHYHVPNFSLVFHWNATIDTFEVTYSISSDYVGEQPQLSGPLLEYMGFNNPLIIPLFEGRGTEGTEGLEGTRGTRGTEGSITIQARSQRQKSAVSGTRLPSGNYKSGKDLAAALENALNGTWFGGQGYETDKLLAPPFHITIKDTSLGQRIYCVPSGRYTPCELAHQIEKSFRNGIVFFAGVCNSHPSAVNTSINVEAVVENFIYKGIRFHLDPSVQPQVPFMLDFTSTSNDAINPARLGYENILYSGKMIYTPGDEQPFYPIIVQGTQRIFRSVQHYIVRYDESMENLRIITTPFNVQANAFVEEVDASLRILKIRLRIAHGLPQGQLIYINGSLFGGSVISGITLPGVPLATCATVTDPALIGVEDPLLMVCCYGGTTNPFFVGAPVDIEFTNSNRWTLNMTYGVQNCMRREVFGLDSNYYAFTAVTDAFRKNTSKVPGLVFSKSTVFHFPNSVQIEPYRYVLVKVTINEQGDGSTAAIETELNAGRLVSDGFNNFIARIPIGKNATTAHWNPDARIFNIQHIAINKLNTARVQIFNPDGTYYNFHGKATSVGLVFNIVRPLTL